MADNMVLNNINGEYVKFYYTTNSILPQTLKRTGAIVIYDNKNFHKEKINSYDLSYNSIYLGGELIIGGIGFSDLKSREQAIKILGEWDGFKTYTESKFDELSNNIINALNVDLSKTKTKVSGDNFIGQIPEQIPSFYIHQAIFDTIESQYKPAEILSEENEIEYFELGDSGNRRVKITVSSYNNEPVDIPIGANINSVTKRIKVKLNDDTLSYISGSYIYYDNNNWEGFLNNNYYNGIDVKLHVTDGETISNNDITNIEFTYIYNENSDYKYYVSEKPNQKILTYNSLWFNGTDINNDNIIKELSYYNVSTNKVENMGIKSIKNIVLEHRHLLNDIVINPKPFIFYYNHFPISEDNNDVSTYTIFNSGNRKILSNKTTDILIESGVTKFIFGIPKDYTINNIYYYDEYNNIKVKTNITSLFVKLDIRELNGKENTVKTSFINLYANKEYILKDGNKYNGKLNSDDNRYCEYDFYSIDFGNNEKFNTDVRIYIEFDNFPNKNISLLSKEDIVDSDAQVNLNFDKQNGTDNWMMLHNDMYLSSNWLSGIDTSNYNNILGYKLKYLQISSNDYLDTQIFNNKFDIKNLKDNYNNSKYSHEMDVFNIDSYDYYKYNINLSKSNTYYPHLIIDESFNESIYIYNKYNYDRLDIKLIHKYIGNYIFTKFYELNFTGNNLDNIDFELLKFVSFDIVDTSEISQNDYIRNKKTNLYNLKYKFLDINNKLNITIDDINVLNNYFIPNDFSLNEYKVYTNLKEKLDELMQSDDHILNLGKYSLYMIIPRSIPLNIKFNYKLYNDEYNFNPEVENFKTNYIYISNFVYKNVKYNIYEFTGELDYTINTGDELNRYILDNITISKK